jgi:quinone-modifying oxidoreductase subunit QmoB
VPRAGDLNYAVVAEALSNGIDGVMLMGCRTGDDYQCHMIRGSELAATRMDNVRETMSRLAVEPERVRSLEVEISAYHELPGMIADFVARIRELGPTEFRVYQYE